jgi:hypothetical protein
MHPVDANKNVVIVLGMHRSGTSAIAAGLEQLGLSMGSSLYQGDESQGVFRRAPGCRVQ